MDELANCPYCGSCPKIQYKLSLRPVFWIDCEDCGLSGPIKEAEDVAIEAWNQVAGMREALEEIATGLDDRPHQTAEQALKGGE